MKTRPTAFRETASTAGLTGWHHTAETLDKHLILEAKCAGVALLDYDNHGWLDIYLVNGSTYKALQGKEASPKAALFHNHHDGTLTNMAANAGVTNGLAGHRANAHHL